MHMVYGCLYNHYCILSEIMRIKMISQSVNHYLNQCLLPISKSPHIIVMQINFTSLQSWKWCWNYIFFKFSSLLWQKLNAWWRHQMETFSTLLAICARNSPVPGEFPAQRPVTRSFDVFFDLRLNQWLSKQSWGWWFETAIMPIIMSL